jgi:hypothetical protein
MRDGTSSVPSCGERGTTDDRRADTQTSAASYRCSRPLRLRSSGDSVGTAAAAAGQLSWLFLVGPSSASLGRQWRDGHCLRRFIEDQFQAADVAAIDSMSFRHIAIVADLGLTRWAFPRWHRRAPGEGIHRGWSNGLAASRKRNHVHFAAAVSLFRALRCPIASQPTGSRR